MNWGIHFEDEWRSLSSKNAAKSRSAMAAISGTICEFGGETARHGWTFNEGFHYPQENYCRLSYFYKICNPGLGP